MIQKGTNNGLDKDGGLGFNCLAINRIVRIIDFCAVGGLGLSVGCVLWTIWFGGVDTVERLMDVSRHGYANDALHLFPL